MNEYKGIKFATNPSGIIMWCENWSIVEALVGDGLATRTTYPALYSHTEYKLI